MFYVQWVTDVIWKTNNDVLNLSYSKTGYLTGLAGLGEENEEPVVSNYFLQNMDRKLWKHNFNP